MLRLAFVLLVIVHAGCSQHKPVEAPAPSRGHAIRSCLSSITGSRTITLT